MLGFSLSMAKTEEGGGGRVVVDYPRDLLKTLISRKCLPAKFEEDKVVKKEEIELGLGLSLNGRFCADPKVAKLTRSSSTSGFNGGNGDEEAVDRSSFSFASSLVRACSLSVETAEEWRKRKELQSVRRMEAKRKRSEKQGSLKCQRDWTGDNGGGDRSGGNSNRGLSGMMTCGWDCDSAGAGGILNGNRSNKLPPLPPSSKAAAGSQGSGSSAISETDNQLQPLNGNNSSGEAQSPASNQPSPGSEQKLPANPQKEEKDVAGIGKVSRMPCVSTKGEGPNGKRTEGFLYRYKKGEEVKIVCICHGRFLSPAEFVRHAGGQEVAQPLKHIIVSPFFLS